MNILITGAYGFVGSNLINSLKNGYSLYGLDIISPAKEGVIKTFLWKDIESADSIHELPHFDAFLSRKTGVLSIILYKTSPGC